MSGARRIRVAGAGALGLTTALALADAGWRVEVFDPAPGANASSVAAGMLAPAFETVLDASSLGHFDLLAAARDLWPALAARAGATLYREGAVEVGEEAKIEAHERALAGLGAQPRRLSGAEIAALAPGLGEAYRHAVFTPADWRLDAGAALAALRAAAESAGVVFHASQAPGDRDELLVVATGASRSLATVAPELARLTPIKGHILRLQAPPRRGPVVRGEGVYAAPSPQGLIVGATMEVGTDDARIDPRRAAGLLKAGTRLFPAIAGAAFTVATGIRAATPDGLPMAGWSIRPGVLLAVGARRNGWLLAPLVAQTVVDCLAQAAPGVHADRLAPGRFAA